jgi:hypothetical protein
MELQRNESNAFNKFINRELIGTGSNGNRVYKVVNLEDNKVN